MARKQNSATYNEFVYWTAVPRRLKISLNLPSTQEQFADLKGVDPRTLRRWKKEPGFEEAVEQERAKIAASVPNGAVTKQSEAVKRIRPAHDARVTKNMVVRPVTAVDDPAFDDSLSLEEQRFVQVKDTLAAMASDGNQGAMDLYLKHFGKAFLQAEQGEFADYQHMSDVELMSGVLEMVGVEAVAGWLADRAEVGADS